jgi:hypothetical protein
MCQGPEPSLRMTALAPCLIGLVSSDYSLLGGRVRFAAPPDWRQVAHEARGDSGDYVAFVVPRPAGDSLAPAGNVMVDVAVSQRHWDLKTYGDVRLGQEAAGPGSPMVIDDKTWESDRSRSVLSTSQLRGTPYALWDKFAVRDSIYVDIRTAIPVTYPMDSAWQATYAAHLDSMIASFRIGTRPVFPDAP